MAVILNDSEIECLLAEKKSLPDDYIDRLLLKQKRGHKEAELEVKGIEGSEFRVIIRQSSHNPLAFSVILGYQLPNTNRIFRLRRYNGKSHPHTNKIEGEKFYDFHIHTATLRYQERGSDEETYAESSTRFHDVQTALGCLIEDCGFELPNDEQLSLF